MAKRSAPGATVLSASTPDSLGAVVDAAREAGVLETRAVGADHDGEHLFASERLVVSPAAGLFTPAADLLEGSRIERGRVVGHVAGVEVRSPFQGTVKGLLAVAGEGPTRSQPVAWLRTAC